MQTNERQWQERVKKGPFRTRRFTPAHVARIEKRLSETGNRQPSSRRWWPAVMALGILTALLIIITPQLDTLVPGGSPVITDEMTPLELDEIRPSGELYLYHQMYDSMDRGKHDLYRNAVIDPQFYDTAPFARGDIIYYAESGDGPWPREGLSRVIGLPGDTVEIREGQIYINDRKLSTFYGEAHRLGINLEAFEEIPETPNIVDRDAYVEEVFKFSMDAVAVPEGQLFVVGDDWLRSKDSRFLGPLPVDRVQGKVVGVCRVCS